MHTCILAYTITCSFPGNSRCKQNLAEEKKERESNDNQGPIKDSTSTPPSGVPGVFSFFIGSIECRKNSNVVPI